MRILFGILVGVVGLVLILTALFVRRDLISRGGGAIEMSFRLSTLVTGRGWSAGIARLQGDEMRWYRVFSFSPRPSRRLARGDLTVQSRRAPDQVERMAIPADWIVLRCAAREHLIEVAVARSTLSGLLSWLEAGPSGGRRLPYTG
jgi:hypothetical protein